MTTPQLADGEDVQVEEVVTVQVHPDDNAQNVLFSRANVLYRQAAEYLRAIAQNCLQSADMLDKGSAPNIEVALRLTQQISEAGPNVEKLVKLADWYLHR